VDNDQLVIVVIKVCIEKNASASWITSSTSNAQNVALAIL
jgi:hypothetical protein